MGRNNKPELRSAGSLGDCTLGEHWISFGQRRTKKISVFIYNGFLITEAIVK